MTRTPAERITLRYIGFGIGCGLALCALAAFGMLRVIFWHFDHCSASTPSCRMAAWLIDFWWLPFLTLLLGGAWWLRRSRDRRLARLDRNAP